jgi:hypothetical protein
VDAYPYTHADQNTYYNANIHQARANDHAANLSHHPFWWLVD